MLKASAQPWLTVPQPVAADCTCAAGKGYEREIVIIRGDEAGQRQHIFVRVSIFAE